MASRSVWLVVADFGKDGIKAWTEPSKASAEDTRRDWDKVPAKVDLALFRLSMIKGKIYTERKSFENGRTGGHERREGEVAGKTVKTV